MGAAGHRRRTRSWFRTLQPGIAADAGLDSPVLFHAERTFVASAATQGLPLLISLPLLLSLPETVPIVLLAALALALWQHRAFRLELTATHLRFRAGALAPTVLIPLNILYEVDLMDVRGRPLAWDQLAPVGLLRLGLLDGSSITVAGIREPREVVGAVRFLRDCHLLAGTNIG